MTTYQLIYHTPGLDSRWTETEPKGEYTSIAEAMAVALYPDSRDWTGMGGDLVLAERNVKLAGWLYSWWTIRQVCDCPSTSDEPHCMCGPIAYSPTSPR